MVESLDAPRRYPRITRGRRACHTTTSSVGTSESGLSQSPLDAYAHLQGGRLGRDFTIINGGSSTQAVDDTVLPSVLFESVRAFIFQFSMIMIGLSSSHLGYPAKSSFETSA